MSQENVESNLTPAVDPAATLVTEQTPIPATPAEAPVEGAAPLETPSAPITEPITFDQLTLPEGFAISEDLSKSFVDLMNDKDMSPTERAQSLIDLQAKALTSMAEANQNVWNTQQETWKTEVKNDPEIGGAHLEGKLANIGKLLTEFGTPELRGIFDLTGMGNNIHAIRFLDKIASQLTEGRFVSGSAPTVGGESAAQKLFPSMKG